MKKYKNTFRFSVAHAIKKNFILPLATFVLSMIFYLTGFCWDVLSEAKNKAAITGQDVMKLMREAYEVFIFDSERAAYEPLISFYPALLVVISLLVGVLLFRFVTNKKTVNVYYSLGIKRADLYTARLVAGIIMMARGNTHPGSQYRSESTSTFSARPPCFGEPSCSTPCTARYPCSPVSL